MSEFSSEYRAELAAHNQERTIDTDEIARIGRRARRQLRVARVIADNFLQGRERLAAEILFRSPFPVADGVVLLGVGRSEAARRLPYVKQLIREYCDYFSKGTYREILAILRAELPATTMAVVCTMFLTRSLTRTADVTGFSISWCRDVVNDFDRWCKANIRRREIYDLFVACRRVQKCRKRWYIGRQGLVKEFLADVDD